MTGRALSGQAWSDRTAQESADIQTNSRKLTRVDWKGRFQHFKHNIPTFCTPFGGREITCVAHPDEVAYLRCRLCTDVVRASTQGVYLEVEVATNPDNLSMAVVDFEAGGCSSVTFSPDTGAVIRERKVREAPRKVEGAYIQPLPTVTTGRPFHGLMGLYLCKDRLAFFRRCEVPAAPVEGGAQSDSNTPPGLAGGRFFPPLRGRPEPDRTEMGPWETTGFVSDLDWAEGRRLTPCLAFRDEGAYCVRIVRIGATPPIDVQSASQPGSKIREQEVKEFAPDPAVLKINLDLSKVWSALSGEALLAIQGIENMSWSMNLEIRKSVGFEEIELAVTSKTLLTGDLRGVVMSMPGIPTTAFRNVSFKAKAKDPRLPLLSLSAKVLKENGRNVLKFPKEDRDVNLQLEDLKVRGNGTYWSGTVARLTNLFSRVGAVNIKAFQQILAALIFRFVVNLANEAIPSELLGLMGSKDHGMLADLVMNVAFYGAGNPEDPELSLFVASRSLAIETSHAGLTDFVNGAFDGLRELGLSDDFEKSRQNLLKLAVEEELNTDINVSNFMAADFLDSHPNGWGPGISISVKMDMTGQAVDAWNAEESEAAGLEDLELANDFPDMPFMSFGESCLHNKSWIDSTRSCRNWALEARTLQGEKDVNDMAFEQSMQLFGSWVHMALKKAFPSLFRRPLEGQVLATAQQWKENCRYAMLSLPSGEWWTPLLAVYEVLQIYNPDVSELHDVWRNFRLVAMLRQTTYTHPVAGRMVAIGEGLENQLERLRLGGRLNRACGADVHLRAQSSGTLRAAAQDSQRSG
ncbi:unnamed protein product [Symbiodinium microadriaticum]|nr:unnamed protein product [Symbiodinium microadriaticum]